MLKPAILASLTALLSAAEPPAPGTLAPAFSAQDQHGKTISLSDFKAKKPVVLYFYPKDDTPGCTAQACSLRDGYSDLMATGAVILGVSADNVKDHKAFAEKFNLPFSLLADPDRKIIEAYGVKSMIGLAKRWTFVIDKQGVLRHVVSDVKTKEHDKQVLELLKKL